FFSFSLCFFGAVCFGFGLGISGAFSLFVLGGFLFTFGAFFLSVGVFSPYVGAFSAIIRYIPAASFKDKRRVRDKLFQLAAAFRTGGKWRIAELPHCLGSFAAGEAFIFIYRHFFLLHH